MADNVLGTHDLANPAYGPLLLLLMMVLLLRMLGYRYIG
jgi:hypothetical protein